MNQFTAGIIFTIVAELMIVAVITESKNRPKVNKIKVNVNGRKAKTIVVRSYTRKVA